MRRHETRVEDGVLAIETDDGWLEIGEMDDVTSLLGETYEIEYDERERTAAWLQTDEGGTLSFPVAKTIEGLSFDAEFVGLVAGTPLDELDEDGIPQRTAFFANMMREIWDSKGNLDRS